MKKLEWVGASYGWVARVTVHHGDWGGNMRFADVYMPGVWTRLDGRLEKERVKKFIVEFAAIRHPIHEFDTEQEALVYVESIFALESN